MSCPGHTPTLKQFDSLFSQCSALALTEWNLCDRSCDKLHCCNGFVPRRRVDGIFPRNGAHAPNIVRVRFGLAVDDVRTQAVERDKAIIPCRRHHGVFPVCLHHNQPPHAVLVRIVVEHFLLEVARVERVDSAVFPSHQHSCLVLPRQTEERPVELRRAHALDFPFVPRQKTALLPHACEHVHVAWRELHVPHRSAVPCKA
mmetsp:Transcript_34797/g.71792  ORF Transcript_34797/g.71792 Transcript_34797/m.71792 type:complete len:201 (+) Transcript_34797:116-718(+)